MEMEKKWKSNKIMTGINNNSTVLLMGHHLGLDHNLIQLCFLWSVWHDMQWIPCLVDSGEDQSCWQCQGTSVTITRNKTPCLYHHWHRRRVASHHHTARQRQSIVSIIRLCLLRPTPRAFSKMVGMLFGLDIVNILLIRLWILCLSCLILQTLPHSSQTNPTTSHSSSSFSQFDGLAWLGMSMLWWEYCWVDWIEKSMVPLYDGWWIRRVWFDVGNEYGGLILDEMRVAYSGLCQ